jgi:hypothetical protein
MDISRNNLDRSAIIGIGGLKSILADGRTASRRRKALGIQDRGAGADMDGRGKKMGQIATGVKISVPMSHNVLTSVEEIVQ